jgi:hypothetical protein
MFYNRLTASLKEESQARALPTAGPPGFTACPVAFAPGSWQQQLFETAYERARQAVTPERQRWENEIVWN